MVRSLDLAEKLFVPRVERAYLYSKPPVTFVQDMDPWPRTLTWHVPTLHVGEHCINCSLAGRFHARSTWE